jgi:hypothetical protein
MISSSMSNVVLHSTQGLSDRLITKMFGQVLIEGSCKGQTEQEAEPFLVAQDDDNETERK